MNTIIWIIQGVLSVAFLIAGSMKLIMPKDKLREELGSWVDDFRESQLKLIGFLEVLGSLGMILPMEFDILPILTLMAACGLAVAMVSAALIHFRRHESILTNIILLLLLIFVAIERFYFVPII